MLTLWHLTWINKGVLKTFVVVHCLFHLNFIFQFHNDMSINKNPRQKHSTLQGSIRNNNDNQIIIFWYTKCLTKVESHLAQTIVEGYVHRMVRDFLM
jgi:hypothetical protein